MLPRHGGDLIQRSWLAIPSPRINHISHVAINSARSRIRIDVKIIRQSNRTLSHRQIRRALVRDDRSRDVSVAKINHRCEVSELRVLKSLRRQDDVWNASGVTEAVWI